MSFELPQLKYAHNALEPHIDALTMEIHHGKHHQGYTNNLNAAIEGTNLEGKSIEAILENLDMNNKALRNNGGGFFNHSLFWEVMSPNGGGEPTGELAQAINDAFGSFEAFKEKAVDTTAAGDVFNGTLAVAVTNEKSLQEAIRFASAAAAISVTREGAQPSIPTLIEIDNYLNKVK